MRRFYVAAFVPALALVLPALASAHEVYVLAPAQIATDISTPPFDMVAVAFGDMSRFIFWGFVTFIIVSTVFFASLFGTLERVLDPVLFRLKRYAPAVCRITVGLGLIAAGYYQATYGPELPLASTYGVFTLPIAEIAVLCGILMIAGVWVRAAALVSLTFFGIATWQNGLYMLTYANYFGEFVVLLLLGVHHSHKHPVHRFSIAQWWYPLEHKLTPYAFAIIRVCFGISLLYAALYAKILHNNLALQVAGLPLAGHTYSVAHYLGFEPHFLVLGAASIELLIASFFIFGVEIRWTSIFLEFWVALSIWYFGEDVWPHIILIGIPIALFMHGYDRYSLEGRFFKKHRLEPAL